MIELDGRQHTTPEHRQKDEARDAALAEMGVTVLRYKNDALRRAPEGVMRDILSHLGLTFEDLN